MRVGVWIEAKSWGAGGEEVGEVVGAGGEGFARTRRLPDFFPQLRSF